MVFVVDLVAQLTEHLGAFILPEMKKTLVSRQTPSKDISETHPDPHELFQSLCLGRGLASNLTTARVARVVREDDVGPQTSDCDNVFLCNVVQQQRADGLQGKIGGV